MNIGQEVFDVDDDDERYAWPVSGTLSDSIGNVTRTWILFRGVI